MIDNYLIMSNEEIANYFNEPDINKSKVSRWLRNNGYNKGKGWTSSKDKIFSDSDIGFIKNNYSTMSYKEIGEILGGFTSRQVRSKVGHLGLRKNRTINDGYFDKIDTPLKAYFLGFIFADGWVCYNEETTNYEFGMQLQSQDRYVLEKINEELGNKNIIVDKKPKETYICGKVAHIGNMSMLRIYSKKLVLSLINNGIETNKSTKDTYPIVKDEFFFDFLRGYIDGDGCFYTDRGYTYMHITCASIVPLEYIKNKLAEFNIDTKIYYENDKKYRLMCINLKEMNKLVNRLYYKDGLFYLQRKYEKVKHYISLAV